MEINKKSKSWINIKPWKESWKTLPDFMRNFSVLQFKTSLFSDSIVLHPSTHSESILLSYIVNLILLYSIF